MKEELLINLDYYIMKLSKENEDLIYNIKKELILLKTFLIMNEENKREIEKSTNIYYKEEDLINRGNYLIEKLEEIENS